MKFITNLKRVARKVVAAAAITTAVVSAGLMVNAPSASAVSIDGPSDCDRNAVVVCGAHTVNAVQSAYNNGKTASGITTSSGSIHDIYSYFNISKADIQDMDNTVVAGTVMKNGDVYIDGYSKPIATNAITAGRQNIAGSTKVTYGGTTFYKRAPSVSFTSNSLRAYVVIKNNQFQFAILAACGNPVHATSKKPGYSLQKQVSVKGANDFKDNVTIQSGKEVEYKITIKNSGEVPLTNVKVRDDLPAGVQHEGNTLTLDGNNVPAAKEAPFFTNDGYIFSNLAVGETHVFKFAATIGGAATDPSCKAGTVTNTAHENTTGLVAIENIANVTVTCQNTPSFSCTSLKAVADANNKNIYNFTAAAAAANGASISGYKYDFGDGVKDVAGGATISHTYAAPGTYTAQVTALVNLPNNKSTTVTSNNCKVVIPVSPNPAFSCDALTATVDANNKNTYHFVTKASALNGATIASYSYDFGDNVKSTGYSTIAHTYAAPGNYTAKVAVNINLPGDKHTSVTSAKCSVPVTVVAPPVATCDSLTATALSRTNYNFVAKASASNGATITGYVFNFGDGSAPVDQADATTTHTYAPGTYTAKVAAKVSGYSSSTVTGPACEKTITVVQPQSAECTGLTATVIGDHQASFAATQATSGGAVLTNVSYDFGDNTPALNNGTSLTATHTYAADGDYIATATLTFTVDGATKTSTCKAPVSFNTPASVYKCTAFDITVSGHTVTVSNFATHVENATYTNVVLNFGDNSGPVTIVNPVGATHTYAADGSYTVTAVAHFTAKGVDVTDSSNCMKPVSFTSTPKPPTPPTTLVNTGAGSTIALFTIVTGVATALYRRALRRNLAQ